jgi:peptidoglycan/LPS O-acetylase OafA/YrhL
MTDRARIPHVPALDGIRGAAVVAVVVYHVGQLSDGQLDVFRGGFLGVDLFFTLSGFLITSLLLNEYRHSGRIDLGKFWSRRARRLLPALLVVVAAVGLYAYAFADQAQLDRIRGDGVATLLYVANWRAIFGDFDYGASFASSPFEHMWSLAIEEQFYVVWPLIVYGLLRLGKGSVKWLTTVSLVGAVASVVAMVTLHGTDDVPSRVYFGSDTRAAAILFGALAALWASHRNSRATADSQRNDLLRTGLEVAALVSAIALALAWWSVSYDSTWLYEGGLALCGVGATVVILAASHTKAGLVSKVLSLSPLRWFGMLSYGLYLWHWPLFVFLDAQRTGLDGWPLAAVRMATSVAVAIASYYLIEQPIRRGALVQWRGRLAVPAGFAASATTLWAATLAAPAVTNSTPAINVSGKTQTTQPVPPPPSSTVAPTTLPGAPPTTVDPRPKRVLYVGDSVSLTLAVGTETIAEKNQLVVLNRGYLGCGLSRGDGKVKLKSQTPTEGDDCHNWVGRWTQALNEFQPDQVVLTLGAWDVADRKLNDEWVHPCLPQFDGWYRAQADEALALLTSTGASLAVTSMPYLRSDVFGLDSDEQDRRVDCVNTILRDATAAADVALIDLAGWVCPPGDDCTKDKEVDGVVLRKDGVHYDDGGGPVAAQWVLDQIVAERAARAAVEAAAAVQPVNKELSGAPSPDSSAAQTSAPNTSASDTSPADNSAPSSAPPSTVPGPDVASVPAAMAPGRVPTSRRPLRVMTVGDSLMFDAQPGLGAALKSTGRVTVRNAGILGFGLERPYPWRTEWKRLLRENRPELIVAMWGGWDVKTLQEKGPEQYQALLDEAVNVLTSTGARVIFIGLPASLDGWGNSAAAIPRDVNVFYAALPERFPGKVVYLNPDPIISPDGVPVLEVEQSDGSWLRVRKIDYDHFCPGGSARIGLAVLALVRPAHQLPDRGLSWVSGSWTKDQRYNDPKDACTRVPPDYQRPPSKVNPPPATTTTSPTTTSPTTTSSVQPG